MNELKTLKDLKGYWKIGSNNWVYDENGEDVKLEDIKAEAVKWANKKTFISKDYQNGKIDFIIDFFNLTAEELK